MRKKNTNTKTKTITLNKKVIKVVEEKAKLENRNFSNMVETLLIRASTLKQSV